MKRRKRKRRSGVTGNCSRVSATMPHYPSQSRRRIRQKKENCTFSFSLSRLFIFAISSNVEKNKKNHPFKNKKAAKQDFFLAAENKTSEWQIIGCGSNDGGNDGENAVGRLYLLCLNVQHLQFCEMRRQNTQDLETFDATNKKGPITAMP